MMDDNEINRRIAKFCGNKLVGAVPAHLIPAYTTDLNAMHEAEKTLTSEQWETYAGHLATFHQPLTSFKFLHATARQRAEALLRTLNLWTES